MSIKTRLRKLEEKRGAELAGGECKCQNGGIHVYYTGSDSHGKPLDDPICSGCGKIRQQINVIFSDEIS